MKRQLVSILLGTTLIASAVMMPVFADTAETQEPIENAEQLKAAIALAMEDGRLSEAEEADIAAAATEEAVADLMAEKLDLAVNVLNHSGTEQGMRSFPDGTEYGIQTYDLGDGCQMTVELRDQAEGLSADVAAPLAVTGEWKAYGNRYFTAKTTVTVAGYDVMLGLENHYILSSNGIDEDRGVPLAEPESSRCTVTKDKYVIEDGVARTPGASDANIYCTFTCKSGTTTSRYKLDTTVQYLAHDTSGKRIKVGHTWKLTKLS